MILTESLAAVELAKISKNVLRPLHESWCFSRIPETIRAFFQRTRDERLTLPRAALPADAQTCEKVVLVLFDGLGWRFLDAGLGDHAFLKRGCDRGILAKLTCEFPSTTVVHLTRLTTGLGPAQACVPEWNYYEPRVGDVVTPFLFNRAGETAVNTLRAGGFGPHDIWPRESFFSQLSELGVASHFYQNARFCPSAFTQAVAGSAEVVPFPRPSEAARLLGKRLRLPGPAFHLVYLDSFDHACHVEGPSSQGALAEASDLLALLERDFMAEISASGARTLFAMTADHGHVDIDAGRVLYLDLQFPGLSRLLKKTARGLPRMPCGGMGRDTFLHVEAEALPEVVQRLRAGLDGRAEVFSRQELLSRGFFAGPVAEGFAERFGDLAVIPHLGEAVHWWQDGRGEVHLKGNHGGLTAQEMEIPWLAFAVS